MRGYSTALASLERYRYFWRNPANLDLRRAIVGRLTGLDISTELHKLDHKTFSVESHLLASLAEKMRPFWIGEQIAHGIAAAVRSLPPRYVQESDLPTTEGFIWFESPQPILLVPSEAGSRSETVLVRGITWHLGQGAASGQRAMRIEAIENPASCAPAWDAMLYFNEHGDEHHADIVRYLLTLFLFMKQRIMVASPERPERQVARQIERRGGDPHVNVITLRRGQGKVGKPDQAKTVEWSHQWLVTGHWRQQLYRKQGKTETIWIAPYVKGPEDKPFVAKAIGYEVTR